MWTANKRVLSNVWKTKLLLQRCVLSLLVLIGMFRGLVHIGHSVVSPSPSVHSGLASIARVLLAAPSSPEEYISIGPSSTRWEWTRVAVSLASRSSIWYPRQYRVYRPVFYYCVCVCVFMSHFHFSFHSVRNLWITWWLLFEYIIINSHYHFAFTFIFVRHHHNTHFVRVDSIMITNFALHHNHCSPSFNRKHNYNKKHCTTKSQYSFNDKSYGKQSFHVWQSNHKNVSSNYNIQVAHWLLSLDSSWVRSSSFV